LPWERRHTTAPICREALEARIAEKLGRRCGQLGDEDLERTRAGFPADMNI
jgi:hypothetical protein